MDHVGAAPLHVSFVEHRSAAPALIDAVCAIKDESWPHGAARQRAWLDAHLAGGDLHAVGRSAAGELVAYANLVARRLAVAGAERDAWGVGNVCVRHAAKGAGLGSALMRAVAGHLTARGAAGVLLCRDALVPFYARNGWAVVDAGRARADFSLQAINVMLFPPPAAAPAPPDVVLRGPSF